MLHVRKLRHSYVKTWPSTHSSSAAELGLPAQQCEPPHTPVFQPRSFPSQCSWDLTPRQPQQHFGDPLSTLLIKLTIGCLRSLGSDVRSKEVFYFATLRFKEDNLSRSPIPHLCNGFTQRFPGGLLGGLGESSTNEHPVCTWHLVSGQKQLIPHVPLNVWYMPLKGDTRFNGSGPFCFGGLLGLKWKLKVLWKINWKAT